jgi:valacyclovir hydrolase
MKTLGYTKFSLLGWSDGGITALISAAEYSTSINKLIVTGANAYVTPGEIEIYESNKKKDFN